MRVLSISARSGHGKDFCAQIVQDLALNTHGIMLGRFAFAWPLKARAYAEGLLSSGMTWRDIATKPPAVRKLLQEIGTEQGRDVFGEDFWTLQAEAFLRLMSEADRTLGGVVISDCRFPNEVEFAKLGGRAPQSVIRAISEDTGLDPHDQDYSNVVMERYIASMQEGVAIWIDSDRPTLTGDAAKHPSETSLLDSRDQFDFIIRNNLTDDFHSVVEQLRPVVEALLTT